MQQQPQMELMPALAPGDQVYPSQITTDLRSDHTYQTPEGNFYATAHDDTTRIQVTDIRRSAAAILPERIVAQDHETRDLQDIFPISEQLQTLLTKPDPGEPLTYGNSNIIHRTIKQIYDNNSKLEIPTMNGTNHPPSLY